VVVMALPGELSENSEKLCSRESSHGPSSSWRV
jgi:hypothetical protein